MPRLLSNENIQLIFSAKDRTRAALKSMNSGLKGVANRAKDALNAIAGLGKRGVIRGINAVSNAIKGAASQLAGLTGLGAGGLVATTGLLTAQGTQAAAEITKYAQALQGTTTQVQTILGLLGGDREDSLELLKNIRERIQEAAAEEGGIRDAFNAVGIGTRELQNLAGSDIQTQFFRFADAIKQADEAAVGTFRSLELVSEEGFKAFNKLALGADALKERIPGLQALGLIVDEQTIERSARLARTFDLVKQVFSAVSLEVSGRLAPIIENLLGNFLAFVQANGGVGELIDRVFRIIIETSASVANRLREIFSGVSAFLDSVGAKVDSTRLILLRIQKATLISSIGLTKAIREENRAREEGIQEEINLIKQRIATRNSESGGSASGQEFGGGLNFGLSDDQLQEGRRRIQILKSDLSGLVASPVSIPSGGGGVSQFRIAETVIPQKDITAARSRVEDLRASFSEVEKIKRDFDKAIDELNTLPSAAFRDGDRDTIVSALADQRDQQLQAIVARNREQQTQALEAYSRRIGEIAQQEAAAVDISSLIKFDTTQSLDGGLKALSDLFKSEFREINVAPSLSETDKSALIGELRQLKTEAEQNLQLNSRISTVADGLETASSITGSLGQLFSGGDNGETEALRQRAQEITGIRQQLQQAFADGNRAEVQSLQNKIQNLTRLQTAEDAIARKRFNRDKKVRLATAVMDTAAAGLKAFRSAPWPANFGAMASALAAGAVQIKTILDQKYESPSVGGISSGGASGGASGSTTAPTAAQLQQTGTAAAPQNGTLTVQFPERGARGWTDDEVQDMFDAIDDGLNKGRYSNARWQRTGT